jgi:hypothetical protein
VSRTARDIFELDLLLFGTEGKMADVWLFSSHDIFKKEARRLKRVANALMKIFLTDVETRSCDQFTLLGLVR